MKQKLARLLRRLADKLETVQGLDGFVLTGEWRISKYGEWGLQYDDAGEPFAQMWLPHSPKEVLILRQL